MFKCWLGDYAVKNRFLDAGAVPQISSVSAYNTQFKMPNTHRISSECKRLVYSTWVTSRAEQVYSAGLNILDIVRLKKRNTERKKKIE